MIKQSIFISQLCLVFKSMFTFQLCLLSKNMKPALQFMDVDITDISKEVGAFILAHTGKRIKNLSEMQRYDKHVGTSFSIP